MRFVVVLLALLLSTPVWAADWTVQRVRGEVTQKIGMSWVAVSRGDVIADNRYLKTGSDGRAGLARGRETIELEGNTQIRIKDAGAELMTTVLQDFGTVSIEAERRNVQHFSVQTKYLAAVVKGTRFTVRADAQSASVTVSRGVVQVQDSKRDLVTDILPGQSASVTSSVPLIVEGPGASNVFTFKGVEVEPGTTTPKAQAAAAQSKQSGRAFGEAVSAAAKSGSAAASSAANSAASSAGSVGAATSSAAQGAADAAKASGANVGQAVSSAVKQTVSNTRETAKGVSETVTETVKDTVSATSGAVGKTLGGLLR
ncbi:MULTISPECIES: FecR domain-containing protein [Devosia]|jgi:hypothetical protein|uniref:FecR domain-containing protein n=1 Tax=Devosia litorisediminis TaxID=2829817 RepID=A0A942I726_9HYPH|nr:MULTISPECIES: FecR domain-containing protein [Devosia]MBS3849623.1 FecR domain-containing protein [Devosia litorisediminis]MCZ4347905.1 FecR domain-containing protein [Devosia neptuniae]|tara:strand:- start:1058 stop:1999 length:942 start_codon:yes stop_codon:yes gene_type:complete